MQVLPFDEIRQTLSTPRLESYRQPGESDFEVVVNYLWNISLCESLYPALHALEIALRNTIHQAATTRYKTPNWFDPPQSPLLKWEQESVNNAKLELSRRVHPHDADRIVAELTFGFWASLLNHPYERIFWQKMLVPAFSHMPRSIRTRHTLSKRLNEIRKLRNRAFHHERISHWPHLSRCHREIHEVISWISPVLKDAIESVDRFSDLYRDGIHQTRIDLAQVFRDGSVS